MKKLVCLLTAMVFGLCACGDKDTQKTAEEFPSMERTIDTNISNDVIYFFFAESCPHCHDALAYINRKYSALNMILVDVAKPKGYDLFVKCAQKFNLGNRIGTPLFCMGGNYLMGWAPEYEAKFDEYAKPYVVDEK